MKFWYIYLLCFYSLLFVLFSRRKEDQRIKTVIQKKKENGEKTKMKALLQTLIGKRCKIHMLDNSLDFGTYYIKAIEDNGLLLEEYAPQLKEAGVKRFNVSLDTLDEEKFIKITKCTIEKPIEKIFSGIRKAEKIGFSDFKINVVLMGGINDKEIPDFIELTKDNDYTVRFIELMPIGPAISWDKKVFISNQTVLEKDNRLKSVGSSGVSHLYQVPGYLGKIGLISPVSNHFCSKCNRLRITSDGKVKACLHSDGEGCIKGLPPEQIMDILKEQIGNKPEGYDIGVNHPSSSNRTMNQIGG